MNNEIQENIDQKALRRWITKGLSIDEVRNLKGDAGYLLNNMIAKYTLALNEYVLSQEAEQVMMNLEVDLSKIYTRRKFYGKQKGTNPFIYEHAIPASIVRQELLSIEPDEELVYNILNNAGKVAVLLRSEDRKIKAAGLNAKMPNGWKYGDNYWERYSAVGIQLSTKVLKVKGAIYR